MKSIRILLLLLFSATALQLQARDLPRRYYEEKNHKENGSLYFRFAYGYVPSGKAGQYTVEGGAEVCRNLVTGVGVSFTSIRANRRDYSVPIYGMARYHFLTKVLRPYIGGGFGFSVNARSFKQQYETKNPTEIGIYGQVEAGVDLQVVKYLHFSVGSAYNYYGVTDRQSYMPVIKDALTVNFGLVLWWNRY